MDELNNKTTSSKFVTIDQSDIPIPKNALYEALFNPKPIDPPTGIRKIISDNFIAQHKEMVEFMKSLKKKK